MPRLFIEDLPLDQKKMEDRVFCSVLTWIEPVSACREEVKRSMMASSHGQQIHLATDKPERPCLEIKSPTMG